MSVTACRAGTNIPIALPLIAAAASRCQASSLAARIIAPIPTAEARATSCAAIRMRFLSVRSAATPAIGDTNRIGTDRHSARKLR